MHLLPGGWRECVQPEIVARRSHQKENHQSRRAELLEGEIGKTTISGVARQQTDNRVYVTERVELEEREYAVAESQHKHIDAEVPSVIQHRQKAIIQPA